MDHRSVWTKFSDYNHWANQKLVQLYSPLDEAAANKTIVSSFPSVKQTFLHIWDAELIWLKRLQGHSLTAFPSENFQGGFNEVLNGLLSNSEDLHNFIAAQAEAFFEMPIEYRTLSGKAYSQIAFQMIQHCLNHSTYHRGQLITMARQLGLNDIPTTDFVDFLRND